MRQEAGGRRTEKGDDGAGDADDRRRRRPDQLVRILSTDPDMAKGAAHELLWAPSIGLQRLRRDQCTLFEQAVLANETLMRQLQDFAEDPRPECVWRKGGRYADLFMFLADRFFGAPDHVLDCESVHAQWKWQEVRGRGMKFKLLNALLKLRWFNNTYRQFPNFGRIDEEMGNVRRARAMEYQGLLNSFGAPKTATKNMYLERFQLRAIDVCLIQDGDGGGHGAAAAEVSDARFAFSNYVRFLLDPGKMYRLTALNANRYVYVTENKSVARPGTKDGMVTGRPLNVVWYEPAAVDDFEDEDLGIDGVMLVPCSGAQDSLPMQDMSIAEISIAAGYYPPDITPDHSERDVEMLHEQRFLDHQLEVFSSRRAEATRGSGWARVLHYNSGTDAEEHAFETREDITKIAAARALQLRDGLTDAQRDRVWQLPKATLLAALEHKPAAVAKAKAVAKVAAAPAVAAPAGPAAPGRGRGGRAARGRRGRGGGRGRRG